MWAGAVALFVGGLLAAGGCIWGLLGLLLMKEITFLEFVLYSGVFLGLILLAITAVPGAAIVAGALAIGFPLLRQWADAHALAKIEQSDIEKYMHAVQKRPEIPYPYRRLAEIHAKRGHYDVAADWYQLQVAGLEQAWIAAFLLSDIQCPDGFTLPVTG